MTITEALKSNWIVTWIAILTIFVGGIVYAVGMYKDVTAMNKHVEESPQRLKEYDKIVTDQKVLNATQKAFNIIIEEKTKENTDVLKELLKEMKLFNAHLIRLQLIGKRGIRAKDKTDGRDNG